MVWILKTRSTLEDLHRIIRAQKFYRTLRFRLDREERRWHETQPKGGPEIEYTEHPPDGSEAQRLLGGAIESSVRFRNDDDDRTV